MRSFNGAVGVRSSASAHARRQRMSDLRASVAAVETSIASIPSRPFAATTVVADEAFAVLADLASRRRETEPIAAMLAARALRVTAGADFAVARDALEALMRRAESARDVELRPARGGYRAAPSAGRRGSYDVWLASDRELEGSCSCPDFGKASLGLCKHLLSALALPRRRTSPRALRWDPVRPLTGPGDRLERLWLNAGARVSPAIAMLFQAAPAGRPIEPGAVSGAARLTTIEALLAACRRDPQLAEPAIAPLLEDELAASRRRLGSVGSHSRLAGRELDRALRGLKRKLFPYQREGVARFLGAGRLLLADDMGLGKTAQAIASCHALLASGRIERAMVVAPASLKPQWAREWRAFTDVEFVTVEGPPNERERMYRRRGGGILLVNYEQLLRDLPHVQAFAPELVILDEAQRIKNWETRTAGVVKRLQPEWRLVLTGTPMENRLDELSSIMEWVDEHALEPRWRLSSWHAIRADGSKEIIGARNLDTLRARLAPAMLRRIRGDVLAQLPPRRDTRIPVALTPLQQDAHDELNLPIARLAGIAKRRPLARPEFLKLMTLLAQQRMTCNALALRDFIATWPMFARSRKRTSSLIEALGSPKLEDLRERLVELVVDQGRKVVVFSQWRRMLQLADWTCGDVLERRGLRAVFFTGQESPRRRDENLVAFHDDPAVRVLFATDAGGVGLNLQRAASCCINLELPWNPAVLEQRVGRIFRLGQDQPVEVYNYIASGGIEERIAHLVGDKRALFTGLFDGTSDEVPFDSSGSFLSRVHEVLRPELADGEDPDVERVDDASGAEPDELEPEPTPPTNARASLDPAAIAELARTASQLEARTTGDGRIVFELPAPAAGALSGLLRALAAALDAPSPAPGTVLER